MQMAHKADEWFVILAFINKTHCQDFSSVAQIPC